MNTQKITFYEEISMNAHPSLKTQLYDGWVLRFSNGYTYRANSVNPIYTSTLPVAEKVSFCEEAYARQNLPSAFKVTDASSAELDNLLAERGYEVVTPTYMFINPVLPDAPNTGNVITSRCITPEWRGHFFRLNGVSDPQKIVTASAMMDNIQHNLVCVQIESHGEVIACGLCVVERGYVGLYDIVVDSAHRQKGYGYELCRTLLSEAVKLGAKSAYLQVVSANAPAIALYKKLGYQQLYQYWYRVKDGRQLK